MSKKIKFLKFQLATAVFVLITVLISGFFILGPELTQIAKAVLPLNGDYDRVTSGDNQIDVNDWDMLDLDFVDQNGDTMSGPLTLPGDPTLAMHAATMQYVDNSGGWGGGDLDMSGDIILNLNHPPINNTDAATKQYVDDGRGYVSGNLDMGGSRVTNLGVSVADGDAVNRGVMNSAITTAIIGVTSVIEDTSGNSLKVLCDQTVDTAWYDDPSPDTIGTDVAFPFGFFSATPQIITSLGGTNNHFKAVGGSNIYFANSSGFSVFVTHLDRTLNSGLADTWNWYVNWCAIGL